MNDYISLLIVGSLLLVSAAAATGSNNQISVDIHQEAKGNCVTGNVYVDQETYAVANVQGDDNYVSQHIDAYADNNDLTGIKNLPAGITQICSIIGNITGNDNHLEQNMETNLRNNSIVESSISQLATQKAEIVGSDNSVYQSTSVDSCDNKLTLSSLSQSSSLGVSCSTCNNNWVDQRVSLSTNHSSLVGSKLWQVVTDSANLSGSKNNIDQQATISSNNARLTCAVENQEILENANIHGSGNSVIHDLTLNGVTNKVVVGSLIQKANITTNL